MVFRGGTEYKGGTIDYFLPIYCNEGGHKNITEALWGGGGVESDKMYREANKTLQSPLPRRK